MKQIRKRLTYANVMSSIAVFIVLGGAAVAATQLPKNSVGSKQLKKNSVTKAKIKNGAVNSAKVQNGSLEAGDFKAGQLPAGPKGDPGATGPAGSAVAYAHILSNGEVDLENSKNLTNANVSHSEAGVYCFENLSFTVHTIITSPDGFGPTDGLLANPAVGSGLAGCLGSEQARVRMTTAAAPGTAANNPFYVLFE